jgi:hypothetical protein
MKYESAFKRLSRFGFTCIDNKYTFWTRNEKFKDRIVELINQNGSAILFPIIIHNDGQKEVIKRNHTIKAMIAFLEGN